MVKKRFQNRQDELKYLNFLKLEAQCNEENAKEMEKCLGNYSTKKHTNHITATQKRWDKESESHKKTFMSLRKVANRDEHRKRYSEYLFDPVDHIREATA